MNAAACRTAPIRGTTARAWRRCRASRTSSRGSTRRSAASPSTTSCPAGWGRSTARRAASRTWRCSPCIRASTSRGTTWHRRLAAGGYAFLGQPTRYLNNDADALHERLLDDVAAAVAWLRGRGFARVVLLGNSGGGSLFAFYLEQAAKAPAERLTRAPSGDRVPLAEIELPPADGLVLLAAHLGEGVFMLDRLDPSVVDEAEPDRGESAPRHVRPARTATARWPRGRRATRRLRRRVPRRPARALRAPRLRWRSPGARRRRTSARGSARRRTRRVSPRANARSSRAWPSSAATSSSTGRSPIRGRSTCGSIRRSARSARSSPSGAIRSSATTAKASAA